VIKPSMGAESAIEDNLDCSVIPGMGADPKKVIRRGQQRYAQHKCILPKLMVNRQTAWLVVGVLARS